MVSLEILLETLRAVQSLLSRKTRAASISRAHFPLNVMYIRGRMLKDGWCPSRIQGVLSQPHGSGSVNYLLSLMPSFDSRDHSGCSIVSCALVSAPAPVNEIANVQMETHINRPELHITETVESILAKDSFPVIRSTSETLLGRLKKRSHANWPFELVSYQPGLHYVAISHVWYVTYYNHSGTSN